ncbi:unnamed protein product [Effrenium voratum]|nr:unnamed protein product [Effrenium voratum]
MSECHQASSARPMAFSLLFATSALRRPNSPKSWACPACEETSAYWNKYEGAEKDLAVGVEQIFLRLLRGILQKQKELGRNPARLDMSGYPEAINLEDEGRRRDNDCAC